MKPVPSAPSFLPLYRQIKLLITQSLVAGDWRPGAPIPSEMELARRYKVSQGTVRKAVSELSGENLLVRHQGKGTFVASHAEEHRKYHFTRLQADRGERNLPRPELLDFRRARADGTSARLLGLPPGAPLLVIRRRLCAGSRAVSIDEARVSATLFRGLTASLVTAGEAMLYSTYEKLLGIRVVRVDEQIKAVLAEAEQARLLGVTPASPLLRIDRVAFTYDDKPVELRRSFGVTADYHYRVQLA